MGLFKDTLDTTEAREKAAADRDRAVEEWHSGTLQKEIKQAESLALMHHHAAYIQHMVEARQRGYANDKEVYVAISRAVGRLKEILAETER